LITTVDRPETGIAGKEIKYYMWKVYEVEIDNGDTITLDEYSAGEDLKTAQLNKKADGAEVTCTHTNNNIVTVADAGITVTTPCILYAFGRKA